MSKLSLAGKIGLAIEMIAGLVMVALVLFNQTIPDAVVWIYCVGVAVIGVAVYLIQSLF